MKLSTYLRTAIKETSLRSGLYQQTFFDIYPYMFSPQQLIYMTSCLKETSHIAGCCVEAGCAYGATTVFLNKFMKEEGIDRPYISIDTFSGFVPDQAEYEIEQRQKRKKIRHSFSENKKKWYDFSMKRAGISNVHSVESDVTKFDFSAIGPIAFCLLDVDIYLPVQNVLPKIYQQMSPGGIIVIDDCKEGGDWDGSYLAYQQFCSNNGLEMEIHHGKLGVLLKNAVSI